MAGEMRALVEEISARLGSVAQGTETLLASAQEIAASSEEQSASTEEIASSANQLAEAADRLTGAVKSFRLLEDEATTPPEQQAADWGELKQCAGSAARASSTCFTKSSIVPCTRGPDG